MMMITFLAFIFGFVYGIGGQMHEADQIGEVQNIKIWFQGESEAIISWNYQYHGFDGLRVYYVINVNNKLETTALDPHFYYMISNDDSFIRVKIYATANGYQKGPTSYASRKIPEQSSSLILFNSGSKLQVHNKSKDCEYKRDEKNCKQNDNESARFNKSLTKIGIVIVIIVSVGGFCLRWYCRRKIYSQPREVDENSQINIQCQHIGFCSLSSHRLVIVDSDDDNRDNATQEIQQPSDATSITRRMPPSYDASEQDHRAPPSYDATVFDEMQFNFVLPRENQAVEIE